MIKLKIDGNNVSFDSLSEARDAARKSGLGLDFWRETLSECTENVAMWNEFLNDLWQSEAEAEAERICSAFPDATSRHWLLLALMLFDGDVWERFVDVWKVRGDVFVQNLVKVKGFMPWLKVVEPHKYDLLRAVFGDDESRWCHWYLILAILRMQDDGKDLEHQSQHGKSFISLVLDAFDDPAERGDELASCIEAGRNYFLAENGRIGEVLFWRNAATASQADRAIKAFQEQDFERAFLFAGKCKFPDREILGVLGTCYDKGVGTLPDKVLAFKWHYLAAENGNEESVAWLLNRAKNGMAEAQMRIGYLLEHGQGICRNYDEAMKWYSAAAKQGCAEAKFRMGYMFHHSLGMWQSKPMQAVDWYKQAAEDGSAKAQQELVWIYKIGWQVEKNIDIAQRWNESAFKCFLASAKSGDANSAVSIGHYYRRGEDGICRKDEDISREWFTKAFGLYRDQTLDGSVFAWFHMANLLAAGLCEDGELTADICYRKAAERKSSEALCELGDRTVNNEKANDTNLTWYYESAELGNEQAMFSLGCYFMHQGSDELIEWFTKAHERYRSGSAAAIAGRYQALYETKKLIYGAGRQSDLELARKWYRIAVSDDPNDAYSVKQLERLSC